jgi:hypothetical protein
MSARHWVALAAIAGIGLASSNTFAAPTSSSKKTKKPAKTEVVAPAASTTESKDDLVLKAPEPLKEPAAAPAAASASASSASSASASTAATGSSKAKAQPDEDPTTQPVEPQPKPTPSEPPPANGDQPKPPVGDNGSLAVGAPKGTDDEASIDFGKLSVHPYMLLSGGLKADIIKNKPGEDRNNRISTFALGRLGLRAKWNDLIYAESEFMASGGVGLHGTSAYEGQAAMQVRQQLIRVSKAGFRIEVGRLIDEASVDYFSAHVAETFLQDTAVRDPLLFSGFNLGNGIRATYAIIPNHLRVGLTFNAGNPVSNTASLMIGGAYPPFERFYTQPYQQVNQSANHFPDDTFHSMYLTPAVMIDSEYFDMKVAIQGFDVNANTNSSNDDHIRGYNVRGTARAKLFDGMIVPFASSAYTRNDTLVATDLSKRASERYQAVNVGFGVDANIMRRFKCSHDCADGFGAQFQQVQYQIGDGLVTTQQYFNLGASYWIAPNVSLNARFAQWMIENELTVTAEGVALGQTRPATVTGGERSVIAALRFIMP